MRKTITISLLILVQSLAYTQVRKFSIKWGNDSIGELTAQRTSSRESETIKINSDSKFSVMLMKQNMTTDCISVFNQDSLHMNKSESVLNNDKETVSTTVFKGSYFCINGEKCHKLVEKIKFTVSKLYFYEPKNLSTIYSERHLKFCAITKVSEGKYKLTLPNGNVNYYSYRQGKLVEMYSKRMGFTLRFIAV